MRVKFLSDLHLELSPLDVDLNKGEFDTVVLAGDIHKHTHGIEWASEYFKDKRRIYVPGNHEFYGGHYQGLLKEMRECARIHGVDFLNRNVCIIEDVCFIGCTLWTDFRLFGLDQRGESMRMASKCMLDFFDIRFSHMGYLTPMLSAQLHQEYREWIDATLDNFKEYKRVVVTHHGPLLESVSQRYMDDIVTPAFASDLSVLIDKHQPDVWVHGHTHDHFDYYRGNTRVICNPKGYKGEYQERAFDPDFILEL